MNLSGILVVAEPGRQTEVATAVAALEGVEVHQLEAASGRMVVVQEATDIHAEIDGLRRIKALPHVVMAEMVYHYFAEDGKEYVGIPAELDQQEAACAVPAALQD